jgi:HSP20 family molecular chaperone IbpA
LYHGAPAVLTNKLARLPQVGLGCVEERSRKLDVWPNVVVDHTTVRVRDTPFKKKTLKDKLKEAAAAAAADEPFELQVPRAGSAATGAPGAHVSDQGPAPSAASAVHDIIIPGLGDGSCAVSSSAGSPHTSERGDADGDDLGVLLPGKRQPPKPVSIVELASSTTSEQGHDGATTTPSHTCVHNSADAVMVVTVDLPGVDSVEEITLDLEPRRASLTASGYALSLALPLEVSVDAARAKFKKKRHQLIITLPTTRL